MTRSLHLRKILWRHISKTKKAINLKFCIRNAFIDIMTHAKFNFNQLMLTLIFGIRASEPPPGSGERLKRPGLIGLSAMRLDNSCFENNTNVCFLSCLNKLLGSHFVKVFRSPWDVHVPLIKSLHFILAQSGNSLIAAACLLKSIQKRTQWKYCHSARGKKW